MDESLRGREWTPESIPGEERVREDEEGGAEKGLKRRSRVKVRGPAGGLAGHHEKQRDVGDDVRAQAPGDAGPERGQDGAAGGEAEDEGQRRRGERAVPREREDVAGVREKEAEKARPKAVGRKHEEDVAEEGEEEAAEDRRRVRRGEAGGPGGDEEEQKGRGERLEDVYEGPAAESVGRDRDRCRDGEAQAANDRERQEGSCRDSIRSPSVFSSSRIPLWLICR